MRRACLALLTLAACARPVLYYPTPESAGVPSAPSVAAGGPGQRAGDAERSRRR